MLTIDHLENIIHNHIKPWIHYLFLGASAIDFTLQWESGGVNKKNVIGAWKTRDFGVKMSEKTVILWSLPSAWKLQDFLMQLAAHPLIAV